MPRQQQLVCGLQDSITQTLFSANLMAEVLPNLWKINPQEAEKCLEQLQALTRGALAEIRLLLLEMNPTTLPETPIAHLMRQLIQSLTGRIKVNTTLTMDEGLQIPPAVQMAFYRITQEALNNTVQHAKAKRIQLKISAKDAQIHLSIHDDGQGFQPEPCAGKQQGLRTMQEQAQAIGAALTITSQPGHGTEIDVSYPLAISG